MSFNFVAGSFYTKKLCSRLSLSEVRFYTENGIFAFLSPSLFGGLGATYDDHLRLIGNHVVDFLLVLIELFSLLRLRRGYERISVQNRQFRSNGGWLKVEGVTPTKHSMAFFSQKTRLNDLSYGIKI